MEPTFKVPIRNVFCMLSYVNDIPELIEQFSDIDDDLLPYDFLANKFNEEVGWLLKRGLIKSYVEQVEETSYISGRMLMNESIPFIVENKPRVVCVKDNYSSDITLNQILKTTLKHLYQNIHISERTRKKSFLLWEEIPSVREVIFSRELFQRISFHRHNIHYKRVINIAHLLYELQILSHRSGNWSLYTVTMNDSDLNHLFENFLFHFYRIELSQYRVKSERLSWHLQGGNQSLLPTLLSDVSLTHRNKAEKIIMDAKFYRYVFQTYYDKNSFHSHNMYQIFTYLMHQPSDIERLRGILVYPFNGQDVHQIYEWNDAITMEVVTVNLNLRWRELYGELMDVVG